MLATILYTWGTHSVHKFATTPKHLNPILLPFQNIVAKFATIDQIP
jgi:hypothetical protein